MNDAAKAMILIVDDESANIQSLAQALNPPGNEMYQLRFAKTGENALALARSEQPALILLDVMLPGMDGLSTLAKLKADVLTSAIPVIFVTARDQVDDEAQGLELGAVDYITKPISPAIVRARVRTHIELRRQREFEAQRARMDGLTGIANRRAFDESFERYWQSQMGLPQLLKLLLIDVDFFKRYNDTLGHGAGDECLKAVAQALQKTFARTDELVARIGGEEFAILIYGGALVQHAQRALDAVAGLKLMHPASEAAATVTVSIGALERGHEGHRADLLSAADLLLYQAKHEGRNRARVRTHDGASLSLFPHGAANP
jgi:diguanylate cyclase (GGDEF)-like protein